MRNDLQDDQESEGAMKLFRESLKLQESREDPQQKGEDPGGKEGRSWRKGSEGKVEGKRGV